MTCAFFISGSVMLSLKITTMFNGSFMSYLMRSIKSITINQSFCMDVDVFYDYNYSQY